MCLLGINSLSDLGSFLEEKKNSCIVMDPFLSEIFLRQAIVSAPRAFCQTYNW